MRLILFVLLCLVLVDVKANDLDSLYDKNENLYFAKLTKDLIAEMDNENKFMSIRDKGIKLSQSNPFYNYVFKIYILSYYRNKGDLDNFIIEANKLINDYKYKNNGWDLYSTWFALFDYQIYRGNYYEALIITSQMSDYAQKNNHKPGIAISNLGHIVSFPCYPVLLLILQ